jgi:two-component system sensor histidine kinase UhpB
MAIPSELTKVLLIEDDENQLKILTHLLETNDCCKFSVVAKSTLKESIEYLISVDCNVDAVLLDLYLPNSQGVNTFLEVFKVCKSVPVVIISGYEDIAFKCISLGAQDYLIKPVPIKVITRSIRYSIERKKLLDITRKLEKKYRELVEVTKASIYEIDFKTNKFIYVNDQMCQSTGYTKEELYEMNPLDILTPSSLKEFEKRLESLSFGATIPASVEYELKVKDGSTRWALVTARFKEDKEGNIIGANVVAIDITNQKLAEEEARRKEEMIFSQLEDRIHKWREEISFSTKMTQANLQLISNEIQQIEEW